MQHRTGFIHIFLFSVLLLFFSVTTVQAQSARKFSLYAKIVDGEDNVPLSMATVMLKNASDPSKVRYATADETGKISIYGIREGRYVFEVEYMGYEHYRTTLEFKDKSWDLGVIKLHEIVDQLEGSSVSAMAVPIKVKKDTLEYTAAAYKITENETLEDLIKKMPGFDVDEEGKITSNGEEIREVRINGEKFFLNDPKIATKNLPANIVDKLKVVRKKSDQAEFTGIDDGKETTIIDLSVKKELLGGWFGNASGGYGYGDGSPHRFQVGTMAATIRNDAQLAVLGNANNTNNRGFNDFAGNMMDMMRQNIGAIHSQIYAWNKGIMTSYMAGVNGSKKLYGGKLRLNGSYLFSGSDSDKDSESNKETFLDEERSLFNDNGDLSNTKTFGHMLGGEIDWKIDNRSSFLIKPQVNIGHGGFDQQGDFRTGSGPRGRNDSKINDGYSLSAGDNFSVTAGTSILFRHRFNKTGRTLSVYADYNYTQNSTDGLNYSLTRQYDREVLADSTLIDQHYDLGSRSSALGAEVKYTEPFSHDLYLQLSYEYRHTWSFSDKRTYDKNGVDGDYDIPVPEFTDSFRNMFINQTGTLLFGQSREKYRFQVGVDVQPSHTRSVSMRNDLVRNVVNFAPRAMFEYEFSDNNNLKMRYNGRTQQPSINQLQPVADNSNPLIVVMGNPDLLPEFVHTLSLKYKFSNPRNFFMIDADLRGTYTTDKITTMSWYDDKGIKYSRPMNEENGVFGARGHLMLHIPIGKSGFSITTSTYSRFERGYSYIADRNGMSHGVMNRIVEEARSAVPDFDPDDLDITRNNVRTLNVSEWLKFRFRNKIIEVSLGGAFRYSKAWYSLDMMNKNSTWTNSVTASVNLTLPWGLNIKTDCRYNFYIGYEEGFNEPAFVWNAELAKTLFKGKGTLSLHAYDMLNQSKSVYHMSEDDYVMDVRTNALQRYVMLSFTYRFGDFGKLNKMKYGDRAKGFKGGKGGYGGRPGGGKGVR